MCNITGECGCMPDEWQFIVQIPVTQEMLLDISSLAGVKDAYADGALLTVIPENIKFETLKQWLSSYLHQKHEMLQLHR
jgi:hypothetical protein